MTENELFKEIQFLLHLRAHPLTDKFTTETLLLENEKNNGLGLDSLDMLEMIFELESKTGKVCESEDSQKFKTVQDVINHFKD